MGPVRADVEPEAVDTSWQARVGGDPADCLITCPDPACGAIAEIFDSVVLGSTGGPIEIVRTRCLYRHLFVLPTDWPSKATTVRG